MKTVGIGSAKLRTVVAVLLLWLLLCSCATSYRPAKDAADTGYSESAIAADRFRINFQGNADTPLEQAYDFALLHCAEVAREHGFVCFEVVDSINTSSAKNYKVATTDTVPVSDSTLGTPRVLGGYPLPNEPVLQVTHEETRVYFKPGVSLVIKCFSAKPQKTFTYDAGELEKQMRQRYRL